MRRLPARPQPASRAKTASTAPRNNWRRPSVAVDQEAYLRLGTVKERVDLERIIDDQYVQFAVERLGPYR